MEQKTISIIIPNYNKEKYIAQCLQSALEQTYPHKQIIVVDDCSTDGSVAIVRRLAQENPCITLIALEENGGVSHARNLGAQSSQSDYVTFLDSDDIYINPRKLENEMRIAEPYKVAFSQYVLMGEDGQIPPYKPIRRNAFRSKNSIADILSISKPVRKQMRGYVVSRQLFDAVGGYSFPYNYLEDFDFQCRLALRAQFVYTGETGEAYRMNTGGLSVDTGDKARRMTEMIRASYYPQMSFPQKIRYGRKIAFKAIKNAVKAVVLPCWNWLFVHVIGKIKR